MPPQKRRRDFLTIAIIGAGRIGQAVAIQVLQAGRPVLISNSQGPESLSGLVKQLGAGICAALESSSRLRDTHRDTQ